MAYKKAIEDNELFKTNKKSIRKWLDQYKDKIKAKPNGTWLYAGRDYDLEVLEVKKLPNGDLEELRGTPMWKVIEKIRKDTEKCAPEIDCDFQTLEDVLKSIREHPSILDRNHKQQKYSNAYQCFCDLEELDHMLGDARDVASECWDRLSEIFASNAEGDVKILEGAADDYGKLGVDKRLIKKELGALLRNNKLSPEGLAVLDEMVTKYGTNFGRNEKELLIKMNKFKAQLKKR